MIWLSSLGFIPGRRAKMSARYSAGLIPLAAAADQDGAKVAGLEAEALWREAPAIPLEAPWKSESGA